MVVYQLCMCAHYSTVSNSNNFVGMEVRIKVG